MIRPATANDHDDIQRIYSQSVLAGLGTFEELPPTAAQIAERHSKITSLGLPWIVFQEHDRLLGYAYGSLFNERSGYRYLVEDSVYIDESARGRGIGRALLASLIEQCAALGRRKMLARVGGAWENPASMRLHLAMGFREVGRLEAVGWKFGRWRDVGILQRDLEAIPPRGPSPPH